MKCVTTKQLRENFLYILITQVFPYIITPHSRIIVSNEANEKR